MTGQRFKPGWLILAGGLIYAGGLNAHDYSHDHSHAHTQLGAHVHGSGYLQIAAVENQMQVLLQVSAGDIVGFEHKPRDQAQQQALEEAVHFLSSGEWVRPLNDKPCTLNEADTHATQLDPEHSGHGDFYTSLTFECHADVTVAGVNVLLFDKYPSVETLAVEWLFNDTAGTTQIGADNSRVDFY